MRLRAHRTFVGNDVLDLNDPRLAKAEGHSRFMRRVLAEHELDRCEESGEPGYALWCHWAAKEAAFKAVTKARREAPVFEHRAFVAEFDADLVSATVRFEDSIASIRIDSSEEWIHALAWTGPSRSTAVTHTYKGVKRLAGGIPERTGVSKDAQKLLTTSELTTIHHDGSAWARIHARRALAAHLRVSESGIRILGDPERPGRAPSRLVVEGMSSPPDLSLSHHGAWVAWAFLTDAPPI